MFRKFFSVRRALFGITSFLALGLIVLSANLWNSADSQLQYAKDLSMNVEFQDNLLRALDDFAEERLLTQAALGIMYQFGIPPLQQRKNISNFRESSYQAMDQVKKGLLDLPEVGNRERTIISEYDNFASRITEIRESISKLFSRPRGERATAVAQRLEGGDRDSSVEETFLSWNSDINSLIEKVIDFQSITIKKPEQLEADIDSHQRLKLQIALLREYMGREQTILAGVISADDPLSIADLNKLSSYRSRINQYRESLEMYFADPTADSKITDYALNMINTEYGNYDDLVDEIIASGVNWSEYSISIDDFLKNSENYTKSVVFLNDLVRQKLDILTQTLAQKSKRKLRLATAILILTVLLVLGCFLIVNREIVSPLDKITKAMSALSSGNKDINVPAIDKTGEIGTMARAVAEFKLQAQRYTDQLEDTVAERTKELTKVNHLLTSSIDYASRIQGALLPNTKILDNSFSDHFILHKQRDVVGGDYYWVEKRKEGIYVAIFDCAGHGVPGALLTMILGSALRSSFKDGNASAGSFLSNLNDYFKQTLSNMKGYTVSEDGLDAAVCLFSDKTNEVQFAGAGIPLLLMENSKIASIKGDKHGIGYSSTPSNYVFKNQAIKVKSGSSLYLCTDGIIDQIGGKGISFGHKRLHDVLVVNQKKSMKDQSKLFLSSFEKYQSDHMRRDDITLIGLKLL